MSRQLFELTRQLVDIPSSTGDEAAVGGFLSSTLQKLGYAVESQELAPGRANILAWDDRAGNAFPQIFFSTHMDTVPPHRDSREDENFIYGRGSCDAKGILAAQIIAAEQLRRQGSRKIGLLFTVDEEIGSAGARLANMHPRASECRYLINGEPTDNLLALGSKGSLRVRLTGQGRPAHSAYPEEGESAIEKLLDVLESVRRIRWPVDPFFGAGTCNIGVVQGGTASNVIPEHAHADLHIRLGSRSEEAMNLLREAVAGRVEMQSLSVAEPMRMKEVPGFRSCVVRFTTDIPHLSRWGTPLLMGPGSIRVAHTEHEHIAKQELVEAVDGYVRLVRALECH